MAVALVVTALVLFVLVVSVLGERRGSRAAERRRRSAAWPASYGATHGGSAWGGAGWGSDGGGAGGGCDGGGGGS